MRGTLTEEVHCKLKRLLAANLAVGQREPYPHLGMSLGKINYCVRASIGKGWVKAARFKDSRTCICRPHAG